MQNMIVADVYFILVFIILGDLVLELLFLTRTHISGNRTTAMGLIRDTLFTEAATVVSQTYRDYSVISDNHNMT